MTGRERREQLVDVGRRLFAEKGYDATSVEEVAAAAGVSKPIVYGHFGGKEGLYAVVVDRETGTLLRALEDSLQEPRAHPRVLMERAALAFLTYIDEHEDGFRILARDSPGVGDGGTLSVLLGEVARNVERILGVQLKQHGYPVRDAGMYAQMLVGMVAYTGHWWLEHRKPAKEEVAARLVNLSWYGLGALEKQPRIRAQRAS
ncbi:TetR/AcrR family transcriptional regulator [Brachybacterium sp. EF45031]|nr:TetR/AcrR family transcriptional regulator [Brachybacterium sillae]